MAAGTKAARHRQWAVNAIVAAVRTNSPSDQETLLWIARHHIELYIELSRKAEATTAARQETKRTTGR